MFNQALSDVLQAEGVFSDDPYDDGNWTGGKMNVGILKGTKFGISAASYPYLDIKNLTISDVGEIYERDYWIRMNLDKIAERHPLTASIMFNVGVNAGRGTGGKILQRAINIMNFKDNLCLVPTRASKWQESILKVINGKPLKEDGIVGQLTIECANKIPHPWALAAAVFGEAYEHYSRGKLFYRAGWLNRIGRTFLQP